MTSEVRWFIPNVVMLQKPVGNPSPAELAESAHQMVQLVEESERPQVHALVDLNGISNSMKLTELGQALRPITVHPGLGWAVAFGSNIDPIAKLFTILNTRIFRVRLRMVDPQDQAGALLEKLDDTLIAQR